MDGRTSARNSDDERKGLRRPVHTAGDGADAHESLVTLPNTWTRDLRSSLHRQAMATEAVGLLRARGRARREVGTAGPGGGPIDAFLHEWDLAREGIRPADS